MAVSRALRKWNLWLGFLLGNACMLTMMTILHPLPVETRTGLLQAKSASSAAVTTSKDAIDGCWGLNGTRVLLLDVHLEGNLGDELETTPLLKELHRCGVHMTAVLSSWLETPQQQLGFRSARAHQYISNFQSPQNYYQRYLSSKYDAILLAPGPWRLCTLARWWPHRIDIMAAGSILLGEDQGGDATCTGTTIDKPLQKFSPHLVLLREPLSYKLVQESTFAKSNHQAKILLSGDLTNSIELNSASLDFWKRTYSSQYKNAVLIFARASNMDHVVQVVDLIIRLKTFDQGMVTINSSRKLVVFATSSELEDGRQLNDWGHKYHDRFQQHQFVTCQTMEQLVALISQAQHVYTDRYHPGVVAHQLQKPFTILDYPKEQGKLTGLVEMVKQVSSSSSSSSRDTLKGYNAKAFSELRDTLRTLKQQNHHKVTKRVP